MIDLTTRYLGLTLKSPLVASASPLCESLESIKRLEDHGASPPSCFRPFSRNNCTLESQDARCETSRAAPKPFAESLNYFPDLQHLQFGSRRLSRFDPSRRKPAVDIPVIASLNGVSEGGWIRYARLMEQAGADAIELNLYGSGYRSEAQQFTKWSRVIANLVQPREGERDDSRGREALPVLHRHGLYGANSSIEAGADALVLFNRFYQPEFDLEVAGGCAVLCH